MIEGAARAKTTATRAPGGGADRPLRGLGPLGRDTNAIKFSWLIRLRWGAIVGQCLTILLAILVFHVRLPVEAMFGLVFLEMAANLVLRARLRNAPVGPAAVAGAMLFDIAVITGLLALSGGPRNPFTAIYLVDVALAAVLLSGTWAWAMLGVSAFLYGLLFLLDDLPMLRFLSSADFREFDGLHLQGTVVAVVVAGAFIVYIVQRVQRALTNVEDALAAERSLSSRRDKVASLASLAAGAAHELSTPLSTIAVAARELERSATREGASEEALQDMALIRSQVTRCRDILHQMSAQAGENAGEPIVHVPLSAWVEEALAFLPERERVTVRSSSDLAAVAVNGPPRGLARVLRGLLRNALQATPGGGTVGLRLSVGGGFVCAEVEDHGCGMSDDILARAGEPFFTTKVPGAGTGLGLFLARALAEQLGGKLVLRSSTDSGTLAILEIPRGPRTQERDVMTDSTDDSTENASEPSAPEGCPSILLVDDDAVLRERLGRALSERGYDVRTAASADEAMTHARADSPELAVLDLRMPGGNGLELLRRMREHDPSTRILVLTGYGSIATAVEATKLGAEAYLPKPVDADEILAAFARASGRAEPDHFETPSLARAEWEHIHRVLADSHGNISEAARRLGIHRRSLQRKLQKYPPPR